MSKIPTNVSILSGKIASITPERRIQRKRNMKSTALLPPRNDQIKNQYSKMIITKKDPILQQLLTKGLTGHKPYIDGKHFSDPTENLH